MDGVPMTELRARSREGAEQEQGPYSPSILENVLCLILQSFQYLATSECNTTSDWLNHTV